MLIINSLWINELFKYIKVYQNIIKEIIKCKFGKKSEEEVLRLLLWEIYIFLPDKSAFALVNLFSKAKLLLKVINLLELGYYEHIWVTKVLSSLL